MTSNQSLPPGWRLDARSPSSEHRECSIRITTPEGREITFTHKPFQFACEITRQLEAALSAQAAAHEAAAPFRIARPEQVRRARGARRNAALALAVPDPASDRVEVVGLTDLDGAGEPSSARAAPGVEL